MKYISLTSVVDAYKSNRTRTKNKFWGLLSILSSIDNTVQPGISYDFSTARVASFLESLFRIDDTKKEYSNDNTWNIILSNQWTAKVAEQMLNGSPNIYDVAIWYFRNNSFNDDFQESNLIPLFLEKSHISIEDAKAIFNFAKKEFEFTNEPYSEGLLLQKLGIVGTNITAEGASIVANPGELSRAPFIQTLYAGQSTLECLIITPFKFSDFYENQPNSVDTNVSTNPSGTTAAQAIYYGCPGTGKSFAVKKISEGKDGEDIIWYEKPTDEDKSCKKFEGIPTDEEKKNLTNNIFRTTFHPDYDYATFVGCYKPVKENDAIDYKFIPQVFTNAYVCAYRHREDPIYLIIEEINRGNCAQIFGDLFQLLDRTNGESDYAIKPDTELAKYLASQGVPSEELKLPDNLHIYATMNTSDQSLFPMDSAFKRRWAMEYMPINYTQKKASKFTIEVAGQKYPWIKFLEMVNERIVNATDSEDKQMGEFFIKGDVDEREFKNKVMFYLWNDVCKDLYNPRHVQGAFFLRVKDKLETEKNDYFTFAELFSDRNQDSRLLLEFFAYLESKYKEEVNPEFTFGPIE